MCPLGNNEFQCNRDPKETLMEIKKIPPQPFQPLLISNWGKRLTASKHFSLSAALRPFFSLILRGIPSSQWE